VPPFLQFRMWLREAPVMERGLAGTAALLVLVIVAIALVPVGDDGGGDDPQAVTAGGSVAEGATQQDAAGAPAAGATPAEGADPVAASSDTAGGGTTATASSPGGATGAGGTAATADACASPGASAPGVTAKEVRVALSVISLAGPVGNATFDIRPDIHEIADALAEEINKNGGVACGRKLVLKHYDVNPLDANDSQTKCLQMVQDNPFLVIDVGGYLRAANRRCFVDAKLPMLASLAVPESEAKETFPYVLSPRNYAEQQARDGILGLKERGFFDAPKFTKLGIFADACVPSVQQEIDRALAEAGVKPNQVSRFSLSCEVAAPPNQIAQAVLQHKGANASHVFLATSGTNAQNYVRIAVGQGYRPQYGGSDYGEVASPSGTGNWGEAFDGAIAITSQHTGELNSGIRNPELQACDQLARRHGLKGFDSEAEDTALPGLCDVFRFFKGAIDKGGANVTRTTFVQGISSLGTFKTASLGDGVFDRPGKVAGGDFQRAIRFHGDCTCWKIVDRDFRPGYRR
jgi:hypothetical protein